MRLFCSLNKCFEGVLRILPDLTTWREVRHLSPLSGPCYGLLGKQWHDREEFDLNKSFNSQETCDRTREECEKRMKEGAETIQRKRGLPNFLVYSSESNGSSARALVDADTELSCGGDDADCS